MIPVEYSPLRHSRFPFSLFQHIASGPFSCSTVVNLPSTTICGFVISKSGCYQLTSPIIGATFGDNVPQRSAGQLSQETHQQQRDHRSLMQ